MAKSLPNRVTKALSDQDAEYDTDPGIPLPSTNPATNLIIADIVMRGASTLFRKNVKQKVAEVSFEDEESAAEALDGRALLTSLALYGASKLATKSPVGLGIVVGGLALKTLYDRGKSRQLAQSETQHQSQSGED